MFLGGIKRSAASWNGSAVKSYYPVDNCPFKVNYRNTRRRCEIYSKLTIKTPERRKWRHSGVFIFNFEYISHFILVFLSIVNFEHAINDCVVYRIKLVMVSWDSFCELLFTSHCWFFDIMFKFEDWFYEEIYLTKDQVFERDPVFFADENNSDYL